MSNITNYDDLKIEKVPFFALLANILTIEEGKEFKFSKEKILSYENYGQDVDDWIEFISYKYCITCESDVILENSALSETISGNAEHIYEKKIVSNHNELFNLYLPSDMSLDQKYYHVLDSTSYFNNKKSTIPNSDKKILDTKINLDKNINNIDTFIYYNELEEQLDKIIAMYPYMKDILYDIYDMCKKTNGIIDEILLINLFNERYPKYYKAYAYLALTEYYAGEMTKKYNRIRTILTR